MRPLQFQYNVFARLGICSIDDPSNSKKLLHTMLAWFTVAVLLLIMISIIVTSTVAAVNYGMDDLASACHAFFPAPANIKGISALASIIIYRERVTSFFEKLQIFLNQSKYVFSLNR